MRLDLTPDRLVKLVFKYQVIGPGKGFFQLTYAYVSAVSQLFLAFKVDQQGWYRKYPVLAGYHGTEFGIHVADRQKREFACQELGNFGLQYLAYGTGVA